MRKTLQKLHGISNHVTHISRYNLTLRCFEVTSGYGTSNDNFYTVFRFQVFTVVIVEESHTERLVRTRKIMKDEVKVPISTHHQLPKNQRHAVPSSMHPKEPGPTVPLASS